MSSKPYDQFSKELLEELLSPFGRVEVNKQVTDEARFVDVLFTSAPTRISHKGLNE